jgi:hypothetical protein
MDDGDVIADNGTLTDDDDGGLVRKDALADGGGLVDVDGKELSTRVAAVLLPEDAVGLRRQGSDGARKTGDVALLVGAGRSTAPRTSSKSSPP